MMERTVVSEIVCQKIRLVDSHGDTVAILGTKETEGTESPAPTFQMYNAEGLAALELSVDSQGAGYVVVCNKDKKPAVTVKADRDNDSGQIFVHNRHSEIAVVVDADCDEDSGRITVCRDGKPVARVSSDAGGGSISVHSAKDARPGVIVGVDSDDDSGQIFVHNRHSEIAVVVDADCDEDSGRITVCRDGKPVAQVNSNADGGSVSVHSAKDARPGVTVRVANDDDGGEITVWRDGKPVAQVDSNADGGSVSVHSAEGARPGVIVGVDSDDDSGEITVWRDGKPVAHVFGDADGGNLAVSGNGETAVHIYSDDDGGQVVVRNKDGHPAVLAMTDVDGRGTVETFEDGNVTSRMPRSGR